VFPYIKLISELHSFPISEGEKDNTTCCGVRRI
jgi:hypothetical protein